MRIPIGPELDPFWDNLYLFLTVALRKENGTYDPFLFNGIINNIRVDMDGTQFISSDFPIKLSNIRDKPTTDYILQINISKDFETSNLPLGVFLVLKGHILNLGTLSKGTYILAGPSSPNSRVNINFVLRRADKTLSFGPVLNPLRYNGKWGYPFIIPEGEWEVSARIIDSLGILGQKSIVPLDMETIEFLSNNSPIKITDNIKRVYIGSIEINDPLTLEQKGLDIVHRSSEEPKIIKDSQENQTFIQDPGIYDLYTDSLIYINLNNIIGDPIKVQIDNISGPGFLIYERGSIPPTIIGSTDQVYPQFLKRGNYQILYPIFRYNRINEKYTVSFKVERGEFGIPIGSTTMVPSVIPYETFELKNLNLFFPESEQLIKIFPKIEQKRSFIQVEDEIDPEMNILIPPESVEKQGVIIGKTKSFLSQLGLTILRKADPNVAQFIFSVKETPINVIATNTQSKSTRVDFLKKGESIIKRLSFTTYSSLRNKASFSAIDSTEINHFTSDNKFIINTKFDIEGFTISPQYEIRNSRVLLIDEKDLQRNIEKITLIYDHKNKNTLVEIYHKESSLIMPLFLSVRKADQENTFPMQPKSIGKNLVYKTKLPFLLEEDDRIILVFRTE